MAAAPPLHGTPPPADAPATGPPGLGPPTGRRQPKPWQILGVAALFLLCCYGAIALSIVAWGGEVTNAIRDRTEHAVGLGQVTRDGNLEFRVRRVQCGISEIGDPLVSQAATGQFCVVQLDVRNVGNGPAAFTDTLQRAYGPGNRQFTADPNAGVLANADQTVFMTDIEPGGQVSGAIVYDIPVDSRIVRLRLHASAHSHGALVRV